MEEVQGSSPCSSTSYNSTKSGPLVHFFISKTMTEQNFSKSYLPPLALAEELAWAPLHRTFSARELAPVEFPMQELERAYWMGGISLDMALQPGISTNQSNGYFSAAHEHWQRVIEHPFAEQKATGIRAQSKLLQCSLPAFRFRRFHGVVPREIREAVDGDRAAVLKEALAAPDSAEDKKTLLSAEIGTQLALSSVQLMAFPANSRESMVGANTVTPEQRTLAHGQYVIHRNTKVPIYSYFQRKKRGPGPYVTINFASIAREIFQEEYPVLQTPEGFPNKTKCAAMAVELLIQHATQHNLDEAQMAVAQGIGQTMRDQIRAFQKQHDI